MVLRNISPRQGTETLFKFSINSITLLRNISPRQGTETTNAEFDEKEKDD